MDPDDQPPPPRRPSYPMFLQSITVGLFVGLVIGVAGVETWTAKWWTILVTAILFTASARAYVSRVVRWFLSDIHIKITRGDD